VVDETTVNVVASTITVKAYRFDPGDYDSICFPLIMPQRWDEGQFRFRILWTPETTNTGDVEWAVYGNSVPEHATSITLGTGGAEVIDTASGTVDSPHLTPWSVWFNFADTPVLDEILYARVQRNGPEAEDTFTGDAEFQLLELQWKSNAPTDA
jgi:hypothetical protein